MTYEKAVKALNEAAHDALVRAINLPASRTDELNRLNVITQQANDLLVIV